MCISISQKRQQELHFQRRERRGFRGSSSSAATNNDKDNVMSSSSLMYRLCLAVIQEGIHLLAWMVELPKITDERDDNGSRNSHGPANYPLTRKREKTVVVVKKRSQDGSVAAASRLRVDPKVLARKTRSPQPLPPPPPSHASLSEQQRQLRRTSRRSRSWPGCHSSSLPSGRRCSLVNLTLEAVQEETSEQLECC